MERELEAVKRHLRWNGKEFLCFLVKYKDQGIDESSAVILAPFSLYNELCKTAWVGAFDYLGEEYLKKQQSARRVIYLYGKEGSVLKKDEEYVLKFYKQRKEPIYPQFND